MKHSEEVVYKTVSELFDMLKEKQAKIDELQKQVEEALTEIGHYWKTGATDCIESAEEALRGEHETN